MEPPIPSPFPEQRFQKEPSFPEPPQGDAICIRYKLTAAQLWRGHLRSLSMAPFNLLWLIGFSFLLTLINDTPAWSLGARWLVYLLLLLLVHEAGAWFTITNKLRSPTGTLTCLQPNGLFESEPINYAGIKATTHLWNEVLFIRNINGTIFFIKLAGGIFIPREAFRSAEEVAQFYEIAQRLHKSRGGDWPGNAGSLQFGHHLTS